MTRRTRLMRSQGCQRRASVTPLLLRLQPAGESWVTTTDATARHVGSDIRVVHLNREPPERQRLCLRLIPHHFEVISRCLAISRLLDTAQGVPHDLAHLPGLEGV